MLSRFMALYFCHTTLHSWFSEVKINCLATLAKDFPRSQRHTPHHPEENQTLLFWVTRMLALGLWSICTGRTGGETLRVHAQQTPLPQGFLSCFSLSLSIPSLPEVMTKTCHYTLTLLSPPHDPKTWLEKSLFQPFCGTVCTF